MNLTWMRHAGMLQKQTLVEKESLDLASKLEIQSNLREDLSQNRECVETVEWKDHQKMILVL